MEILKNFLINIINKYLSIFIILLNISEHYVEYYILDTVGKYIVPARC